MGLINTNAQASAQQPDPRGGQPDNLDDVDTIEGSSEDLTDVIAGEETGPTFDDVLASLDGDVEGADLQDDAPEATIGEEPEADEETTEEEAQAELEEEEAQAEEAEETEEEPEADPQAQELLTELNDQYEDTHFESLEDLVQHYQQEREANDALFPLFDAEEKVLEFNSAALQQFKRDGRVNIGQLVQDIFGQELDAPDPEEDPEAYAEYMREQGRREALQQHERQRMEQLEDEIQNWRSRAQTSLENVREEFELEKAQEQRFRKSLAQFIEEPGEDFARVVYLGLNHDEILSEQIEEARTEGRNEVIREMKERRGRGGDGIPKLSSSRTTNTPESSEQRELVDFAKELQGSGDPIERELARTGQL